MNFSLTKSMNILEETPAVLSALLSHLSPEWINTHEGDNTWTVKEVAAHLIICEETDWLPRMEIILSQSGELFLPIDMTAHFELSRNSSLKNLLRKFARLRAHSLKVVYDKHLDRNLLRKTGVHPKLGKVTLQQLLAAWVTHDLCHLSQITRVMAKQNRELVGPFETFLTILNK